MVGHPTPYPELNSVLEELVTSVQVVLGDVLVGAYLQGSFCSLSLRMPREGL